MAPQASIQTQDVVSISSVAARDDAKVVQASRVGHSAGPSARPVLPDVFKGLCVLPNCQRDPAAAPAPPNSPFHQALSHELLQAITGHAGHFGEPAPLPTQLEADAPCPDTASTGPAASGESGANGGQPGGASSSGSDGDGGATSNPPASGVATQRCSLTATASCLLNLTATMAGTSSNAPAPPHGARAVCGKRAKMEDTFSVQTNFADVPLSPADDAVFQNKLPARIALQIGEQLEQNTNSTSNCSPPVSVPLSPNSPMACAPCLSSSDTEASVGGSASSASSNPGSTCSCDTLHFFGVYDGHGGVEAAQHCANRLHYHLSVALAQAVGAGTMHTHDAFCVAGNGGSGGSGVQCQAEWNFCTHEEPMPTQLPAECDGTTDLPAAAMQLPHGCCCASSSSTSAQEPCSSCKQGRAAAASAAESSAAGQEAGADSEETASQQPAIGASALQAGEEQPDSDSTTSSGETARSEGSASAQCMTAALECALRDAFLRTDEEFAEDGSSAMVGSTAVVALVGTKKMWIANCGDSRAVLCRGGKAIQVTDDHKPEREDEAERVEKAGGQVLYWNGHRVMGVLAMSRAIGDHGLRPYVIPEPEITVLARVVEDDFLLLASDGLWDVMTNQEAITLAMRCIQRSWEKGTSRKAAVRVAASVLTKAAVDRGSKDNVTVVIIDLKAPQPTSSDGKQDDANGCAAAAGAAADQGPSPARSPEPPAAAGQEAGDAVRSKCSLGGKAQAAANGACGGVHLPHPWAGLCAAAAAAVAADGPERSSSGPHSPGLGLQQDSLFQQDPVFLRQQTIVRKPPSYNLWQPDAYLVQSENTLMQSSGAVLHTETSALLQSETTLFEEDDAAAAQRTTTLLEMDSLLQTDTLLLSPVGPESGADVVFAPGTGTGAQQVTTELFCSSPWSAAAKVDFAPQGPEESTAQAQVPTEAAPCQGSRASSGVSPWLTAATQLPPQIDLDAGAPLRTPDLGTPTLLSVNTPLHSSGDSAGQLGAVGSAEGQPA